MRIILLSFKLYLSQMAAAAVVAGLEILFWGHWGPVLPSISMLLGTVIVLSKMSKAYVDFTDLRFGIYIRSAVAVGITVLLLNLILVSSPLSLAVLLGLGASIGTLICSACAGDLALSLTGQINKRPVISNENHFRDWPSLD